MSSTWNGLRGFGAASLMLLGCSVLYDLSPDQCGATSECTSRFGRGYVCSNGLCVNTTPGAGSGGAAGKGGEGGSAAGGFGATGGGGTTGGTDPEGGDGAGATDGGQGGGELPPECALHRECMLKYGDLDAHACVGGQCVPVTSDECPLVLPQNGWVEGLKQSKSNAILLGAYSPTPDGQVTHYTRFFELAVNQLNVGLGGLVGPGGTRRQVVMVVCDGRAPSTESLDASATHLIQDLQVPGVVSTLQSEALQYVFENYGLHLPGGTFFMSGLDADEIIANTQDDGLIWTMLAAPEDVAAPIAPVLTRAIEYLRRPTGGTLGAEDVRVALVRPRAEPRLLRQMASAAYDTIEFNGMSARDNATAETPTFTEVEIVTVYDDAQDAENQSGVIEQLLDFQPHVIIAMATDEFLSRVIPGLESEWAERVTDQERPFYIVSPYHIDPTDMPTALNAHATVRTRLVGVAYASSPDPSVYADYRVEFRAAYPEVGTDTSWQGYENFYDAPYYLLYATAAAGSVARLTGQDIAQGMTRLLRGPTYQVGSGDMPTAMGLLQNNASTTITLQGTMGMPTFSTATGARRDFGSVYCVRSNRAFATDIIRLNEEGEFVEASPPIGETCIPEF